MGRGEGEGEGEGEGKGGGGGEGRVTSVYMHTCKSKPLPDNVINV